MLVRLSDDDVRALKRLAREWKCTRSEVLRRLLRAQAAKR
jgi:hypothetical protein